MQNPAYNASFLWAFLHGYYEKNREDKGPVLPLLFVVLPITLNPDTFDVVKRIRVQNGFGLRRLVSKFYEIPKSEKLDSNDLLKTRKMEIGSEDLLYSLNARVVKYRKLTLTAIGTGIASGLFVVDADFSKVVPLGQFPDKKPEEFKYITSLGRWMSEAPVSEVLNMLMVTV